MLKKLDRVLGPVGCIIGSWLPDVQRRLQPAPLVIRPGGMGDLVCADIALQELGRDARDFTWLIERRSRPWADYRKLPFFCYDEQRARMLWTIWRRHSLVINTEQFFGLAQACALLARSRKGRLACFATTRGASRADAAVPYDWRDTHETVAFARLFASALGLPDPPTERKPRPRLNSPDAAPIAIVSGCQSPSRALGLDRWLRLLESWHHGRSFLVAASPDDAPFAEEIVRRSYGRAAIFHGTFAQLCDAIAHSEEVFTVDGGPVHIASYFGVPSTVVFSSGRTHKWAPLGEGSRIIQRNDLPCRPCTKFGQVPPCPIHYECLKVEDLPPEDVFARSNTECPNRNSTDFQ